MINIPNLVQEICLDKLDDPMQSQSGTVLRGLLNSIQELNYFSAFKVKTQKFTVTSAQLKLPEDVIGVIRVAIIKDGVPYLLGTSQSLWRPTDQCDEDFNQPHENVDQINFYNYSSIDDYQEHYPVKAIQFPGFYRYIQEQNRIVIGSGIEPGDELLIEYHTSIDEDALVLIPDHFKPVIVSHFLRDYFSTRNISKFQIFDRLLKESIKNIKISELPSLADIVGVLKGQVTNRIR